MANEQTDTPTLDSSELRELKQKVVDACHILDHEGITDGYGHVSIRVPNSEAFVTIAAVSPGCATVDRLIMLDLDGNFLDGVNQPPNEWPIHACIMRSRPEVMSVCHTHSKWSTLFSVLPEGLRPLHQYGKFLSAGGPPIYPGSGLVNNMQRGEALVASLKGHAVVLLRAHGDAVVGTSVEQAIQRTTQLSFLGELAHLAAVHGQPQYMTDDELATFAADSHFPARAWEYFVSRVRERRPLS